MTTPAHDSTIEQIQAGILKVFKLYYPLIDDTTVNSTVYDFCQNTDASTAELIDFIDTFSDYMDNDLGGVQRNITKYSAMNNVLLTAQIKYLARITGYGEFAPGLACQSFDGGETCITTILSALGPNPISNISTTYSGAFGNTTLTSFTLLNVTTPPGNSLSDHLNSLAGALEVAIGTEPLLIQGSLTLNSCNATALGPEIYSTPETPSLVDSENANYACAIWDSTRIASGYNGLSTMEAPYCGFPPDGVSHHSACLYYLTGGFYEYYA